MKTATRPRHTKLPLDSIAVESFVTNPKAQEEVVEGSIDLTCAVNTQWVCGTGKRLCPGCM